MYLLLTTGVLLLALGFASCLWPRARAWNLTITASTTAGTREHVVNYLRKGAAHQGVTLRQVPTIGSLDSLKKVDAGEIDLALVQGTIRLPHHSNLRHVATLYTEPLQLLVKKELQERVSQDLKELSGKSINLGPVEGGTNLIAAHVLTFAGLHPQTAERKEGYVPLRLSHAEILRDLDRLEQLVGPSRREARPQLPDAFFVVSTLPSLVVKRLVAVAEYRLVALTFSRALTLIDVEEDVEATDRIDESHLQTVYIPEFTYSVSPAIPAQPCPTVGIPLVLVAHKDVPDQAVTHILSLIYSQPVQNVHQIPKLSEVEPRYPFHPATIKYRDRDKPILRSELIDVTGRFAGVGGSLLGGLLALFGYYRWRRLQIFRAHFQTLLELENVIKGTAVDPQAPQKNEERLAYLNRQLDQLQRQAISDYCANRFYGDGVLDNLLAAIADVRWPLRHSDALPAPNGRPSQSGSQ